MLQHRIMRTLGTLLLASCWAVVVVAVVVSLTEGWKDATNPTIAEENVGLRDEIRRDLKQLCEVGLPSLYQGLACFYDQEGGRLEVVLPLRPSREAGEDVARLVGSFCRFHMVIGEEARVSINGRASIACPKLEGI